MKTKLFICTLGILGSSCFPKPADQLDNSTYLYLKGAEIQCETTEQCREVSKALKDILTLSTPRLLQQRYHDYHNRPNQWSVITVLNSYIISDTDNKIYHFDETQFFHERQAPKVKALLEEMIQRLSLKK